MKLVFFQSETFSSLICTRTYGSVLSLKPALAGNPRQAKTVTGENGTVDYDKLMFATGSSPFIIPCPGHDLSGVIAYRDLDDTNAMIEASATPGARAVVIGGGLLGLPSPPARAQCACALVAQY